APAKTRNETILHSADFLGVGIASNNHLFVRFDKRVEGIKKFFLSAILSAEELHIVDEEQIKGVVILLEPVKGFVLVGPHDIGHILFRMDIADLRWSAALLD